MVIVENVELIHSVSLQVDNRNADVRIVEVITTVWLSYLASTIPSDQTGIPDCKYVFTIGFRLATVGGAA